MPNKKIPVKRTDGTTSDQEPMQSQMQPAPDRIGISASPQNAMAARLGSEAAINDMNNAANQIADENAKPMPEGPQIVAVGVTEEQEQYRVITERDIARADGILQKYKSGKTNLEARIQEDELWWELRHWEAIGRGKQQEGDIPKPKPTSAWLFQTIISKYADAMDNYPEPVIKPREKSDEVSAKMLQSVLPVILKRNNFEETYSDNHMERLKHGTGVYGIFWNKTKENGMGDIDIRSIDLLNIFWEPGISDIQDSRNLFICELVDTDVLDSMYPEHAGKMSAHTVDLTEYLYDDSVDTSGKSVVVDWYYKITDQRGVIRLHYVKYVGNIVLYASQNDPDYAVRGFYDHGKYPVVLDPLYKEKGTPVGFGYISLEKDPQMYIDELSANLLESAMIGAKTRYLVNESIGVNMEELNDFTKTYIKCTGNMDPSKIYQLSVTPPSAVSVNMLEQKINEMKETSSNRDVNNGGQNGVTTAAGIAALQESGNKTSRAALRSSYNAYTKIIEMVIELIRQFYTTDRTFRITGEDPTQYQYIDISNANLQPQVSGVDSAGELLFRTPVFDLDIKAQKKNPFSQAEENARAQELYGMGFFNPDQAQAAIGALNMMEFEGIDKVREYISQGQTLQNIVQQLMQQNQTLMTLLTGNQMQGNAQEGTSRQSKSEKPENRAEANVPQATGSMGNSVLQATTPMTPYGQRLAASAKPNMNTSSSAASPTRK